MAAHSARQTDCGGTYSGSGWLHTPQDRQTVVAVTAAVGGCTHRKTDCGGSYSGSGWLHTPQDRQTVVALTAAVGGCTHRKTDRLWWQLQRQWVAAHTKTDRLWWHLQRQWVAAHTARQTDCGGSYSGSGWLHTPQDRQTVVAVTAAVGGCTHRKTDRLWWHLQRQWVAAHTARQTDCGGSYSGSGWLHTPQDRQTVVAVTAAVGGHTPQDRQTVVAVTAAVGGCTHRKTDRLWWHLQRQWVAAHTARQTDCGGSYGGSGWLHTPQDRQTVVALTAAVGGCTHRKTDRLWWQLRRQWVAAHTARQTDCSGSYSGSGWLHTPQDRLLVAVTAAVGGCTHRKTDRLWWLLMGGCPHRKTDRLWWQLQRQWVAAHTARQTDCGGSYSGSGWLHTPQDRQTVVALTAA